MPRRRPVTIPQQVGATALSPSPPIAWVPSLRPASRIMPLVRQRPRLAAGSLSRSCALPYEAILYDKRDRVATITLNRPEVLNAFSSTMAAELLAAFRDADADSDVGCIILTGAGRGFCSGADVRAWAQELKEGRRRLAIPGRESLCQLMFDLKTPIIAAINGPAVGLGCTLTLSCDIRIASSEARMGLIFARVGLIPEFGSTFLLSRIVGLARAKELVFTARIVDAQEALSLGLVNRLVPAERLMEEAWEMALTIARGPTLALGLAREGLQRGLTSDLATADAWEAEALDRCRRSPEHAEGVNAFLEKRSPRFHKGD
jgi:2-(1,2-epoxy-1,2-dihydrophenyl)acetyl-CoA isomerase